MPISAQEKDALKFQLSFLLDNEEPEAILATMRRVAELKAYSVVRGAIRPSEAARWQNLFDALTKADAELKRALTRDAKAARILQAETDAADRLAQSLVDAETDA